MESTEGVEFALLGQAELAGPGPGSRSGSSETKPPPVWEFGFKPHAQQGTGAAAAKADLTVLLADDNEDLRYVMELTLQVMGYAVISCGDAAAASAAFRCSSGVDLLLTDLEMPGRSGAELARELSAIHSSLPVMIVSGSFLTDEFQRETREKGWIFLAKPFGIPEFSRCIQSLLTAGQQQAVQPKDVPQGKGPAPTLRAVA